MSWNAGTSTLLTAPTAIGGLGFKVFPPNIGFFIPATASLCRVSAPPLAPDVGDPYELRDGYTITLTAIINDGRTLSTIWSSFGSNGFTTALPTGEVVTNPAPTLVFPVTPGNIVRGSVSTDAISAVTGVIEWQ